MDILPYNRANSGRARNLRKNMTEEEKKLWYQFLNKLPVRFRRQKAIGNYIVDFYCTKHSLVIEIDGCQHGWQNNSEEDEIRDAYLKELGLTVLRYRNVDINTKFNDVCNDILKHLKLI